MKTTSLFTFVLTAIVSLAVMVPLSSEAGPRRKDLGKCSQCKMTVYSYYKVTGYEKSRPVYGWETSGHQSCAKKMADAHAKAEAEAKVAAAKSGSDESAVLAKPLAYGGGSGYGRPGYGGGYGGGYHRHPVDYPVHRCRPGCGHGGGHGYSYDGGFAYDGGYGYGLGYGSGTVVRSVTVTRSTPSTLGLFGGFPGTATQSYTTRTQVSRHGGFAGGIWSGGFSGGFSGCR